MSILTDAIRLDREYGELCSLIKRNFRAKSLPIVTSGLSGGAQDALIVSLILDTEQLRREQGKKTPVLVICSEEKECQRLCREYSAYGFECAHYIGRDLTFYNITASHEFEHERLLVLCRLLACEYDIVFTTPDVALGYTIPPERLSKNVISIDGDTRCEPMELAARLVAAGYVRVDMVEGAGQFAVRGGIVDIYPRLSPRQLRTARCAMALWLCE